MTPQRRRRFRAGTSLAVLVLALGTAGCSEQTTSASAPAEPRSSSAPAKPLPSEAVPSEEAPSSSAPVSPSVAAEPSDAPTAAESATAGADAPEARPAGLPGRLLPAEQLPGFTGQHAWTETGTRSREGSRPFGTCHKFAMTSIGAMKVVTRSYVPAGGGEDTAGQLVADFADEMTARRAFEVLKSWRADCEEQLQRYERREVGSLQAAGPGSWYLLGYGPAASDPDAGYVDAQGLVRVGSRIAVLEMRVVGEEGEDPGDAMVTAVERAAGLLG
ncbi:MAG TPA: hypothetical protein VLA97_17030 [Nocardioidaceae bacterium]|nr:hypothetical protein [Nocardioidaceae bacterium]